MSSLPVEVWLFGAMLLAIALSHRHALAIALLGLTALACCEIWLPGVGQVSGASGLLSHLTLIWSNLANLALLLTGFSTIERHVEASGLADRFPAWLPRGAAGAFTLLAAVFVLSAVLDNIAAALIGGAIALHVFQRRVHPAYVAAIVAAANAGGAGSVIGDTTSTMLWLGGVSPSTLARAYIGASLAFVISAVPAAYLQQRFAPMSATSAANHPVAWLRISLVAVALAAVVIAGSMSVSWFPVLAAAWPVTGLVLWLALFAMSPLAPLRLRPERSVLNGTLFLLALVAAASLVPLSWLGPPTQRQTFAFGLASAVFDNIPLTAVALEHGDYDWPLLAYAVGFGGSMTWFGSSAGVAITGLFPESRNFSGWLKAGWPIALAYAAGYVALVSIAR